MGVSQEIAMSETRTYSWQDAPTADLAVIGRPVAHSLSPKMHGAALRALGLPWRYVALEVEPGCAHEALDHLRGMGYRGLNVTLPLKTEAYEWVGQAGCDEFCRRIKACNTIDLPLRKGTNTDGPGLLAALADLGIGPCETLILGAGGAARAVAAALEPAGYRVSIYNRTAARAERLVEDLALDARIAGTPRAPTGGLLVNATSAGHSAESLGIEWVGAGMAYDLSYADGPTDFMRDALAHGWDARDGRSLLVRQGALSLEWWLGGALSAPIEVMREAIS